MPTAPRIVVTQESVRQALAEWHAQRMEAEREFAPHEVQASRDRVFTRTPGDYASDVAPFVFTLLTKYAEREVPTKPIPPPGRLRYEGEKP
jgi:hypothetical protein